MDLIHQCICFTQKADKFRLSSFTLYWSNYWDHTRCNDPGHAVPVELKGWSCYFTKWQTHPLYSAGYISSAEWITSRLQGQKAAYSILEGISYRCDHLPRNYPANTTKWPNAGLMLAQRHRQWTNISPALGQRLVFSGKQYNTMQPCKTKYGTVSKMIEMNGDGVNREKWLHQQHCYQWHPMIDWQYLKSSSVRIVIFSQQWS